MSAACGWGWSAWSASVQGARAMEYQGAAERTASARLGPRPLPLHLAVATMTWLTSRGSWPLCSGALPLWRPEFRSQMEELDAALQGVQPKAFADALESAIRGRFGRAGGGNGAFRAAPVRGSAGRPAEPVAGGHDAAARLPPALACRRPGGAGCALARQPGAHPRPDRRAQPDAGAGGCGGAAS